jgi:hypothetical protein
LRYFLSVQEISEAFVNPIRKSGYHQKSLFCPFSVFFTEMLINRISSDNNRDHSDIFTSDRAHQALPAKMYYRFDR